ncbi:MAG TPA: hypothetical protein ENI23_10165 [bacterium]|nr:hypothetical protein [bacterium]
MPIKEPTKKPIKSKVPGPPNLPKQLEKECRHGTKILLKECDKCIKEFTESLKEFKIKADIGEICKLVDSSTRELVEILIQLIVEQKYRMDDLERRTR